MREREREREREKCHKKRLYKLDRQGERERLTQTDITKP